MVTDRTLDRKQAADYLGMSVFSLHNWVRRGNSPVPYHKVGRKVVFKQSDLDAYIARCRVAPCEVKPEQG